MLCISFILMVMFCTYAYFECYLPSEIYTALNVLVLMTFNVISRYWRVEITYDVGNYIYYYIFIK